MNSELLTLAPVSWLVRGGLYFFGAFLVGMLIRHRSAAWRVFFWRSVLFASIPLAAVSAIGWSPDFLTARVTGPAPAPAVQAIVSGEIVAAVPRKAEGIEPAPPAKQEPWLPAGAGEFVVWLMWGVGAAVVALRRVLALRRRQREVNEASEVRDPDWLAILSRVTGSSNPPRLLRHPAVAVPCAWGVCRPTIMIPAAVDRWSIERRAMVLEHEWSHLKRRDPLWSALALVVCMLHWPNPLVWLIVRRLRLAEEHVADDAVLRCGFAPDRYAMLLVECARSLVSDRRSRSIASSMAQPSTVPLRVRRILDPTQDRGRLGWWRCTLSVAGVTVSLPVVLWLTPALAAQGKIEAEAVDGVMPADAAGTRLAARQYASSGDRVAAAEFVKRFLLADGIEAKLAHVRFPEKVAPLMRKWYEAHSAGPVQCTQDEIAATLTKLIRLDGMTFTVVTLQLLPSLEYKFFAVESTPQGLKLDWETAVGWQAMSAEEFRKTRPSTSNPFRVHVGQGDYYNRPYADESRWLCCELTYPGDDSFRFFGYADRQSPAGATLARYFANGQSLCATIAIAYDQDGSESNQVTICSIIREEWFSKTGPPTLPAAGH